MDYKIQNKSKLLTILLLIHGRETVNAMKLESLLGSNTSIKNQMQISPFGSVDMEKWVEAAKIKKDEKEKEKEEGEKMEKRILE